MIRARPKTSWLWIALLTLPACGGNVVVDGHPAGTGGAAGTGGGSSSVTNGVTSGAGGGSICPAGTCKFSAGPPGTCQPPTGPKGNGCCKCGADGLCSEMCECASPDTPVATPDGDRPIASLREGDLVYSVDGAAIVAAPILATHQNAVRADHHVVRVRLANGATIDVSRGHPTLDGRVFGELRAGGRLGGVAIDAVEIVPYACDRTYDILPATDSGGYFAGGALVGSTLRPAARVDP
jgi:hypothetical protein